MFILQHKFTRDKSKLNLGANVGDIPRGVNRPEVNPTGLGSLFEVPLALGDIPHAFPLKPAHNS